MKEVTIRKSELIEILNKNLKAHQADFKETHNAWKTKVIKFHHARIYDIEHGNTVEPNDKLEPAEPASYENNYLQALQMLEMEVSTQVTLGRNEFRQFVQDEWDFSSHFRSQVQGYTGKMRNNY